MGMMYHRFAQKKRDLGIFWWDRQCFCLIIKQKAGWLVGIAQCGFLVASLRMHAGVTSVALTAPSALI